MKKIFFLIIIVFTISSHIWANGFKILGIKGTKATSMGEAFVAQADDPSAVAFNPAGLTQLQGTQVQENYTLVNMYTEHTSLTGIKTDINDEWQLVPAFYLTSDFGQEKWGFGLGITTPAGISTSWAEDSFARYVNTFSELIIIDFNLAAAYQVNDQLSVGVGGSYYYSEVTLRNKVDYGLLAGLPGAFDGNSRLYAKGNSFGWNIGAIYKFNEKHRLGVSYKSEFEIDFDNGKLQLTNNPAFTGLPSDLAVEASTKLDIPSVLVVGYEFKPSDQLKFEVDLDWTFWETLNEVEVDINSIFLSDIMFAYNYRNTMAIKFGSEYWVNDNLAVRGGYIFNPKAVPEESFTPSLPESTDHFFTMGVGWFISDHWTLDTGAQFIYIEDRDIDNNVNMNELTSGSSIDGLYQSFSLGFMATLTYKF